MQTPQTVRFLGQKSLGWGNSDSWVFILRIDKKKFDVGTHITIIKYHLMYQDNSTQNNTLLKGTIVGLSDVQEGEALYTVRDDTNGRLTTVRVPVRRTNINMEGGWTWMTRPLWGTKSRLLKVPNCVSQKSLWGSGARRTNTTPSGYAMRNL